MQKSIVVGILAAFCSIGYGEVSDDLYTKCYDTALDQVGQGLNSHRAYSFCVVSFSSTTHYR